MILHLLLSDYYMRYPDQRPSRSFVLQWWKAYVQTYGLQTISYKEFAYIVRGVN